MINPTERFKAIGSFIAKKANNILDIGTDHALIPIYLSQTKKINKIIATDIKAKPLLVGQKNLDKHNISNVELIHTHDLKNHFNGIHFDYLTISGLGAITMIKILDNAKHISFDNLLIQTSDAFKHYRIREYLFNNNYKLVKENIIEEKKVYYITSLYKPSKTVLKRVEQEIYFGKLTSKKFKTDFIQFMKNKPIQELKKMQTSIWFKKLITK